MVKPRPALDRIDRKILALLRENGRITYQALSERVGLSPRPALERVRKLEAAGVIQSYTALIDPHLAGETVVALAEIAVEASRTARGPLERFLNAHPLVAELQVVSGEWDYIARIVAPTLETYEELTHEWLADPALAIARINTTFVLRTLKQFRGYPLIDIAEN